VPRRVPARLRRQPAVSGLIAVAILAATTAVLVGYHSIGTGSTPASSGPAPATQASGTVAHWIQAAEQVLETNSTPAAVLNTSDLWIIIQGESGGNPRSINLVDSNAQAGHPSKGLMQTIDSTFDTWHLPGYDNIWDPVSNIIAGTRYALARYGSLDNVPGVRAVHAGHPYVGY
jgi:hypothetical protein